MERHTMQDGTIPLSGLSPSAVSRQWVSGIDPANYEIFGIAYPIAFTKFCMPIICHSTNSKTDFKQLSVNNSSSTLTQLVVQEKNKQEAGIYAIIIGY